MSELAIPFVVAFVLWALMKIKRFGSYKPLLLVGVLLASSSVGLCQDLGGEPVLLIKCADVSKSKVFYSGEINPPPPTGDGEYLPQPNGYVYWGRAEVSAGTQWIMVSRELVFRLHTVEASHWRGTCLMAAWVTDYGAPDYRVLTLDLYERDEMYECVFSGFLEGAGVQIGKAWFSKASYTGPTNTQPLFGAIDKKPIVNSWAADMVSFLDDGLFGASGAYGQAVWQQGSIYCARAQFLQVLGPGVAAAAGGGGGGGNLVEIKDKAIHSGTQKATTQPDRAKIGTGLQAGELLHLGLFTPWEGWKDAENPTGNDGTGGVRGYGVSDWLRFLYLKPGSKDKEKEGSLLLSDSATTQPSVTMKYGTGLTDVELARRSMFTGENGWKDSDGDGKLDNPGGSDAAGGYIGVGLAEWQRRILLAVKDGPAVGIMSDDITVPDVLTTQPSGASPASVTMHYGTGLTAAELIRRGLFAPEKGWKDENGDGIIDNSDGNDGSGGLVGVGIASWLRRLVQASGQGPSTPGQPGGPPAVPGAPTGPQDQIEPVEYPEHTVPTGDTFDGSYTPDSSGAPSWSFTIPISTFVPAAADWTINLNFAVFNTPMAGGVTPRAMIRTCMLAFVGVFTALMVFNELRR